MNQLQRWAGLGVLASNALAADLPIQRVVLYKNGVALSSELERLQRARTRGWSSVLPT